MNWIDSHSRVDNGVTVGSYRINRLLCADYLVLLASSEQGLQHALGCVSDVGNQAGLKISSEKTEVLCLSSNPRQCAEKVSGVQVRCGGLHEWRKTEQRDRYTDW